MTVDSHSNIQTKRLVLRHWRDSDVVLFAKHNADADVMEHFPSTQSFEESADLVKRIRSHFDLYNFGLWAVELKESGEFIGFVGAQHIPYDVPFILTIEIGWRIGKEFWGHGYAPEAAVATLKDIFDRFEIDEVVAMTATTNLKSMRVMEKIGMSRNKSDDFDHPKLAAGHRLAPHVLYRIKRSEFEQSSAAEFGAL